MNYLAKQQMTEERDRLISCQFVLSSFIAKDGGCAQYKFESRPGNGDTDFGSIAREHYALLI